MLYKIIEIKINLKMGDTIHLALKERQATAQGASLCEKTTQKPAPRFNVEKRDPVSWGIIGKCYNSKKY